MKFASIEYDKIQFLVNQSEINQILYYDAQKIILQNNLRIFKDKKLGKIILFNLEDYMSQLLKGIDSLEKYILLINVNNQSLQKKIKEFTQPKKVTTKYVGFIVNHSIESLELSIHELKLFSKNLRKHLLKCGIAGMRWRNSNIQYWLDMVPIIRECLYVRQVQNDSVEIKGRHEINNSI